MTDQESAYQQIVRQEQAIRQAIAALNDLNAEGSPIRTRALSLAITNLEQGCHWLENVPLPRGEASET